MQRQLLNRWASCERGSNSTAQGWDTKCRSWVSKHAMLSAAESHLYHMMIYLLQSGRGPGAAPAATCTPPPSQTTAVAAALLALPSRRGTAVETNMIDACKSLQRGSLEPLAAA